MALFPVLYLVTWLASLWVASTAATNIEPPGVVREVILGAAALLWGLTLVWAVGMIGTVLGLTASRTVQLTVIAAVLLAAFCSYAVVLDVRLDPRYDGEFDTDHALPQLLLPAVILLLAGLEAARGASRTVPLMRVWSLIAVAGSLIALSVVWLTLSSSNVRVGSPPTLAAIAATLAYALVVLIYEARWLGQGGLSGSAKAASQS